MAVFAACKKSESQDTPSSAEIAPLTGTWEQVAFVPPQYTPASYIFKTDLSYSKFLTGDKVGEKGTYRINPANDMNLFIVLLKKNSATIADTIIVQQISRTEINIKEKGLETLFRRK